MNAITVLTVLTSGGLLFAVNAQVHNYFPDEGDEVKHLLEGDAKPREYNQLAVSRQYHLEAKTTQENFAQSLKQPDGEKRYEIKIIPPANSVSLPSYSSEKRASAP